MIYYIYAGTTQANIIICAINKDVKCNRLNFESASVIISYMGKLYEYAPKVHSVALTGFFLFGTQKAELSFGYLLLEKY